MQFTMHKSRRDIGEAEPNWEIPMSQANPEMTFANAPAPPRKLTFQFSIRSILIATAFIALILGAIAAPELIVIPFVVSFVAFTAILVTAAISARGWFRAFAIGALVPNVVTYLALIDGPNRAANIVVGMLFSMLLSTAIGFVASLTHGFLRRRDGKVGIPNIPWIRNWLTNQ